ncbi:RNA polymerase sigma-70 factor [Rhabdobacter roseus]|uniref:RNA polymerase sigma-70 factor (ECF subfamily) n=1 Tax=Rhabdobacter roseus TaxID=1655419 RepID=A0A840TKU1_9BACT|nr:RNA polymerase sigma-70 factor [Rhabdobacter roseus]MBB5283555.1 RNA polymerase sigma-70 factor (ECF subfamily) [Rhabdobacter roseus]
MNETTSGRTSGTAILLNRDKEEEFERVFKAHFKPLHAYANTLVKDDVMAEEMVQNVFCRLWEKTEQIEIRESVSGYLYRSVYHESLNYLKHLKVRDAYRTYVNHHMEPTSATSHPLELKELEQRLEKALRELPEKCRTIFQMSRFEELKYQEIADRLQLPVKTVENQMGKALRLLRLKLVDFLPASLLLFFMS